MKYLRREGQKVPFFLKVQIVDLRTGRGDRSALNTEGQRDPSELKMHFPHIKTDSGCRRILLVEVQAFRSAQSLVTALTNLVNFHPPDFLWLVGTSPGRDDSPVPPGPTRELPRRVGDTMSRMPSVHYLDDDD
jgi:hypothetical protein